MIKKGIKKSESIKTIQEENDFYDTISTRKHFSRQNSNTNKKGKNNIDYQNQINDTEEIFDVSLEENDYTKILAIKNFSEFKNYETENAIFIHIQNLFEKLNEKIMKIFFDFFTKNEKDENKILKFNPISNGNCDDGIVSYLFIREEFENLLKEKKISINEKENSLKEKENLLKEIRKINSELEKKNASYKTEYTKKDSEAKDLKFKLNKQEVDLRYNYINNLEKFSKYFFDFRWCLFEESFRKIRQ